MIAGSKYIEAHELVGLKFNEVFKTDDEGDVYFKNSEITVRMYHQQDCCESVRIQDINGLENLVDSEILTVKQTCPDLPAEEEFTEFWTWTLFEFTTKKGNCSILWYGTSNGYYSEGVSLTLEKN